MTSNTILNGFDSHPFFEGGYISQGLEGKCFKNGANEMSLTQAKPNCQSLDPYTLINRLGSQMDRSKVNNDRRELESQALSEFKFNSN